MLDRRQFMMSAAAACALPSGPVLAGDDGLARLLDDVIRQALADSPQLLTLTGAAWTIARRTASIACAPSSPN